MSKYLVTTLLLLGAALTPATAFAQDNKTVDQTYLDFQVETAARVKAQTAPQYPDHLRAAQVAGNVLVQFVVDEAGTPQMDTFKVLRSSDAAFSESVRRAVSKSAFFPAEIKGKKVKQLVQQPYTFANGK
jgi:protein TonB